MARPGSLLEKKTTYWPCASVTSVMSSLSLLSINRCRTSVFPEAANHSGGKRKHKFTNKLEHVLTPRLRKIITTFIFTLQDIKQFEALTCYMQWCPLFFAVLDEWRGPMAHQNLHTLCESPFCGEVKSSAAFVVTYIQVHQRFC